MEELDIISLIGSSPYEIIAHYTEKGKINSINDDLWKNYYF